jgi:uncharacterized protein
VSFWREKSLSELSDAEWESLCDGCARCCLIKLEDDDTGELHFTDLVCNLLDLGSCRCTGYPDRHRLVPDCIEFDADLAQTLHWLPDTCAYRLVAEGEELPGWHPLVSGRAESVHEAGISVRGRVQHQSRVAEDEHVLHVVRWVSA